MHSIYKSSRSKISDCRLPHKQRIKKGWLWSGAEWQEILQVSQRRWWQSSKPVHRRTILSCFFTFSSPAEPTKPRRSTSVLMAIWVREIRGCIFAKSSLKTKSRRFNENRPTSFPPKNHEFSGPHTDEEKHKNKNNASIPVLNREKINKSTGWLRRKNTKAKKKHVRV